MSAYVKNQKNSLQTNLKLERVMRKVSENVKEVKFFILDWSISV